MWKACDAFGKSVVAGSGKIGIVAGSPPVAVGRYRILGPLGRGGMGLVILGRDSVLGREVAIKEVLEPDLRPRFEREASITARLQHPAIVPRRRPLGRRRPSDALRQ